MYAIPTTTARHISRRIQRTRLPEPFTIAEVKYAEATSLELPRRMLDVIAASLQLSPFSYALRARTRLISDLRFVGALLLRQKFPNITLHEIGLLFGGQDHTSILNALRKAEMYLYTGNTEFTEKYITAARTVDEWIVKNKILLASVRSVVTHHLEYA